MHTLLALLLFVVVFVVPNQVIAEDEAKDVEKRQVSVLARDGHLPYEGKRYVGEKQPDTKDSRNGWRDSVEEPSVFFMNKRYVGALAKTGDLRFRQRDEKRDDVDTLIDELLTAEELRKIRLEALREELLKQREEEDEDEEGAEKRSLASLVRSGSLPFTNNKRSISSMAKAGYLRSPFNYVSSNDYDKRGISSLARNGQLQAFGKRGGISSVMRNGYSYQKRNFDSDLDNLLLDEYDIDDKRNVASLARAYSFPTTGKRNIASFARNGWLQNFGPSPKRALYEEWDDPLDESKRNLPSLLRNRVSPLTEGKRYLGAFVASNRLPYSKQIYDDSKRNIASMVRSWNTPESWSGSKYGKRDWYDEEIDNDDIAKRYVSSLLKQGPLPVSSENVETNSEENQNYNAEQAKEDESENIDEEKRHLGSLLAHKSFAMRKKKSITLEDQFGDQPPTASSPQKTRTDENKMNNEIQQTHRQKRDAFPDLAPVSDEYPMPVMQNTEISEYEDGNSRANFEEQNTRKKRYFGALARNGWLPQGHYRGAYRGAYQGAVSKRHIGALARLGWLPSFRNVRGFSRFGRDTRAPCKRNAAPLSAGRWEDPRWATPARGEVPVQQPQLWAAPPLDWAAPEDDGDEYEEEVEDPAKRYLLIPALDNILLRRNPINWIH